MGVFVDQHLVVASSSVDAQLPAVSGGPRSILDILDPGGNQSCPGLPDGEDFHAFGHRQMASGALAPGRASFCSIIPLVIPHPHTGRISEYLSSMPRNLVWVWLGLSSLGDEYRPFEQVTARTLLDASLRPMKCGTMVL